MAVGSGPAKKRCRAGARVLPLLLLAAGAGASAVCGRTAPPPLSGLLAALGVEAADDVSGGEALELLQQRTGALRAGAPAAGAGRSGGGGGRSLLAAHAARGAPDIEIGPWGLDLAGMNLGVRPGDDFYSYSNGRWLGATAIPADQSSWSEFSALAQQSLGQVRGLLETGGSEGTKTGSLYKSFMDEQRTGVLGASPLQPLLSRVANIKDHSEFAAFAGASQFGFGSSPFSLGIGADPKDPEMNVAQLDQSGLGLPSRDYYLQPSFASKKAAYQDHIAKMLGMVAWPEPAAASASVVAFEESIARVSWEREKLRDPVTTYNKMTVAELPTKAPGFDWPAFMEAAGPIPAATTLIVSAFDQAAGDGVRGIAKLVGDADISVLRAWEAYKIIVGAASYLSQAFVEESFEFYGKTLGGQKELKPRWKRGVATANSLMGDAVGKEYVAKYFPESSKKIMDELTGLLKEAFARRVKGSSWMTAATQQKAMAKLEAFKFETGYPNKFIDYTELTLDETDLFGNVERAIAFSWDFNLKQLGHAVDHGYWGMPPQVVNAFYSPSENKCVFLAAILQPPFYNPSADMAVNFGGIGAVIGHEMTHGFDDSGRKYDGEGRLDDWWTPADAVEFDKRAQAYGEQFWNFTEGLPAGLHIRPGLTMGENIADLGGLTIAFDAYHLWLQSHSYQPQGPMLGPQADGREGDRRFFASWAQIWRAKDTEGALQQRLTSDPHSPGPARGSLPPRNIRAWYTAFDVQRGDASFLEEASRAQIW